jgi:hypothetical protein
LPGRILLITYHFGARSTTGGFRWHAMLPDLEARGWRFDVITASAADPTERSPLRTVVEVPAPRFAQRVWEALRRRVPKQDGRSGAVAVESTGGSPGAASIESAALSTSTASVGPRSLRQVLGDALLGLTQLLEDRTWARRALDAARILALRQSYHAIVVSSPPHTSQLVGVALSSETGLPYVGDYRDPWSFALGKSGRHIDPISRLAGAVYEWRAQMAATVIVHNTPRAMRRVAAALGNIPGRRVSIANGYDEAGPVTDPDPTTLRIVYGGWIHPYMDIRPILAAVRRLRDRTGLDASQLRIEFLGSALGDGAARLLRLVESEGLTGHAELIPRLPREEAVRRQQRASVLVAVDYPHGNAVVMKFYDYLQMKGVPLLISARDSALTEAAASVGIVTVEAGDASGADALLDEAYRRWAGRLWTTINDPTGVHSRRARVAEVDALFRSLG